VQLIAAAKLSGGGVSKMAVNASLAFIEGAKPKDEVESALLILFPPRNGRFFCVRASTLTMSADHRIAGASLRLITAEQRDEVPPLHSITQRVFHCSGGRNARLGLTGPPRLWITGGVHCDFERRFE
jgi:hypothetical protein